MKKKVLMTLLLILVGINLLLLVLLQQRQDTISGYSILSKITTRVTQLIGKVSLDVMGRFTINLYSPKPITYFNRTLDLNASASITIDTWWFTLRKTSTGEIIYSNVSFIPNISFIGARGENELNVYAKAPTGEIENRSVIFNISVPNQAPFIIINESFRACENTEFSKFFEVIDNDFDDIQVTLNQTDPFYTFAYPRFLNKTPAEIFSVPLTSKSYIGHHRFEVSATDGSNADFKIINLSVYPVNTQPFFSLPSVTTLETFNTTNTSFSTTIDATDNEDGHASTGNLRFNATFLQGQQLFTINPISGALNFTYNLSNVGNYKVRICVTDNGLALWPESILYCNETGEKEFLCLDWDFSITQKNRRPNITDFGNSKNGKNLSLEIQVGEQVIFNISAVDPDLNTPYIEWYLDSRLLQRNQTSPDYLFLIPDTSMIGAHKLFGVATDLLLNDTMHWNLTIIGSPIPPSSAGGGGGGGGSGGGAAKSCSEKWGCNDWSTCQSSINAPIENLTQKCLSEKLPLENCGYQIRRCVDTQNCSSFLNKPKEIQVCFFTNNPACSDGIRNCHSGSCELLIDCGGPCKRCPTCSDGMKNQDEQGIDCGGPCPICVESPLFNLQKRVGIAVNLFIFLALIILVFILYEIVRIKRLKRAYSKKIKQIVKPESK